jgi:radical SAM superfamily enzyme YgiQ (UPF0313 family)
MINGSFVFGLDHDDSDVFSRTVEWGVRNGITTATYHILTPYPGTSLFNEMDRQGRIVTRNWDLYDTRHVVYRTQGLTAEALERGYSMAYKEFYRWSNIFRSSFVHDDLKRNFQHLLYTGGWKKLEPLWNFIIKTRALNRMLPVLESILETTTRHKNLENKQITHEREEYLIREAI